MSDDSFFTLKIFGVTEDQEDVLVSDLFDLGCAGVYEDLALPDQSNLYGESWNQQITETYPKILKAHFQTVPAALVEELSLKFTNLTFELNHEAAKDWNAEWKKGFKSFEFVKGFWIQPSWETQNLPGKIIRIDPGMAFGTGTHATTKMAAQLILKSFKPNEYASFLDIGTGTGILAFLAALMGGSKISVTENDAEAIRVLNENAVINNIQFNEVVLADLPATTLKNKKYKFVVANIIQTVLEKLHADIVSLCDNDGLLVLSGVLEVDAEEFLTPWLKEFTLVEKTAQDEWSAFLLRRNGKAI